MSHITKQTKEELEKAEQFNKLMQEVGKANAFQIQMPDDFLDTAYDWFIREEKKANIVFVSRYSGFGILTFENYLPSNLKKLRHETKVDFLTKLLHLVQMRDKLLKEVDSGRRTLVDAIGWMDKIFRKPKYNIKILFNL
jgi:hypothetical protein